VEGERPEYRRRGVGIVFKELSAELMDLLIVETGPVAVDGLALPALLFNDIDITGCSSCCCCGCCCNGGEDG